RLRPEGGLGDRLIVRVDGLQDPRALNKATLSIDGRRIDGLTTIADYTESSVSFDLAYNGKNNTAWNALFAQQGWTRPVVVTIAGNGDSTISAAAMALIGISAATAVGAVSIDAGKRSDAETKRRALQTEQATLQARRQGAAAGEAATIDARLAQITEELR